MTNIIVIAVVVLIVGLSLAYIIREKKRGAKCIGCPHARECASNNCCSSTASPNRGGGKTTGFDGEV